MNLILNLFTHSLPHPQSFHNSSSLLRILGPKDSIRLTHAHEARLHPGPLDSAADSGPLLHKREKSFLCMSSDGIIKAFPSTTEHMFAS